MTEKPQLQRRPKPAVRLAAWGFFLAFAAFTVFLALRSLQPRMPGMPATGGTMTTPTNAPSAPEHDGMQDTPRVNKP